MTDGGQFSTPTTDTLNVDSVSLYFAYKFRVMVTTPGYACGDTLYSDVAMIVSSEDWDEDGIPDNIDLDDDNDGILDISEGEDVDTDGDGILKIMIVMEMVVLMLLKLVIQILIMMVTLEFLQ